MPLTIRKTRLDGVVTFDTSPFQDERGSFARLFCINELSEVMGDRKIVQMNQSVTKNVGAIRGLHYQHHPFSEMKIVRCLSGRVFDVAVDIRKNSPTFLQWVGVELSASNNTAIVIPEGFAHGFQVLEEDSVLLYAHTNFYQPASEGGLYYKDTTINIEWPIIPTDVSERDMNHPLADQDFHGVDV